MIVDDNNFNIVPVKMMLENKFAEIADTAENGQIALLKYQASINHPCNCPNRTYKLIFMDIAMPVMNGIEATKRILELERERRTGTTEMTNIVALTSFTNDSKRRECLEAGMKQVYNKPMSPEILEEIIQLYFTC